MFLSIFNTTQDTVEVIKKDVNYEEIEADKALEIKKDTALSVNDTITQGRPALQYYLLSSFEDIFIAGALVVASGTGILNKLANGMISLLSGKGESNSLAGMQGDLASESMKSMMRMMNISTTLLITLYMTMLMLRIGIDLMYIVMPSVRRLFEEKNNLVQFVSDKAIIAVMQEFKEIEDKSSEDTDDN